MSECNGALSCGCPDCTDVRRAFLETLRLGNSGSAPPLPTEAPPRPPSTPPPRVKSDKRPNQICTPPIIREGCELNTAAPIPREVPTGPYRENSHIDAPFRARDLPLLTRVIPQEDAKSKEGSEAPSESVTHIPMGRISVGTSGPESDWHFATLKPEEWIYDEPNIPEPNRFEVDPRMIANATLFDIHSNAPSESSWVFQNFLGRFRTIYYMNTRNRVS